MKQKKHPDVKLLEGWMKSQVIAALFWRLISSRTFMKESLDDPGKQFAWFIVALVLLIVVENHIYKTINIVIPDMIWHRA